MLVLSGVLPYFREIAPVAERIAGITGVIDGMTGGVLVYIGFKVKGKADE